LPTLDFPGSSTAASGLRRWFGRRAAILLALAVLVVIRSAVFVFFEQSQFDSNQAVIGLMAKHLVEGRAFPVFMYGQNYQLAVESWLAAPLFALAGPSVTALKLPLLAINLAIVFLLVHLLLREVGLRPGAAALATLFVALPAPGTAAKLLEASGGTVEPLLYAPLLWVTRKRPGWCGLVLGVGFVHREFTLYALAALLVLAAARRSLFTREGVRHHLVMLRVAAEVWLVVQLVRQFGSAMGPGTTIANLPKAGGGFIELASRLCLDVMAIPQGLLHIVTIHWPLLFGTEVHALHYFRIASDVTQGLPGAGLVLGAAMAFAAVRVALAIARAKGSRPEHDFCAYLVLVGLFSVTGYVVARCGVIQPSRMRYDMLSLLGAVGLSAWFLATERSRRAVAAWSLVVLAWAALSGTAHVRLLADYLADPPAGGKRLLVRHLEARGIRYAVSTYGDAYAVSFLSNERILMSSSNRVRIRAYEDAVRAHRREAVRLSSRPCDGGTFVMQDLYFCPAIR
jgi:hypothetical protein